jgi:hypothetical protein
MDSMETASSIPHTSRVIVAYNQVAFVDIPDGAVTISKRFGSDELNEVISMRQPLMLLLVVFTAAGCYTSPFPLSDPADSQTDLTLEGIWEPLDVDPGDNPSRMHVLVFNENEYYIELEEDTLISGVTLAKPEQTRMRAFVTMIAGDMFASVQELGTDDKDFMFVNVARSGDILTLKTISEDLFENTSIASTEELVAFVAEHLEDEQLYDSDITRYRKRE